VSFYIEVDGQDPHGPGYVSEKQARTAATDLGLKPGDYVIIEQRHPRAGSGTIIETG